MPCTTRLPMFGRSPSVGPPRSRLRPALCCMAARCGLAWADGARRCSAGLRPFGGAARPPRRARCPSAAEAHLPPRPPKGHLMSFIETADHTSLFVTDWGSGPPAVFTHAWGLRSDEFNYQVPALTEAGLWCVLYDRRGHGRSDRPASGYDLDTLADDLAAVIGHFDLHEATLVAHSLGSKEAVRYLTRYGDARIARLVLIAPTTPLLRRTAGNPGGLDPALIDANYAAVAANVPKWCADFEAAGPYFGSSPGGSPGLVDWTIRMIVDTPLPVLLETLKVNADADMRAELQKIQVPALIIHGDQDASAPIDLTGRKTADLISGASLTVYQGAGHGLYASDHDALNADLLAFINGEARADSGDADDPAPAIQAERAKTPGGMS